MSPLEGTPRSWHGAIKMPGGGPPLDDVDLDNLPIWGSPLTLSLCTEDPYSDRRPEEAHE